MAILKTMYKGVTNSPETFLKETLAQGATTMYVADGSVFGTLPTLVVIGDGIGAETVLVKSGNGTEYTIQRAFEGTDKTWTKGTIAARNFTNYDYQALVDNVTELSNKKIPTKLSELASDSTHRTVTDSDKNNWNGKVDTVNGMSGRVSIDLSKYTLKEDFDTFANDFMGAFDALGEEINTKVNKVDGKALSTNDYTNTDKNKVSHLTSSDANHEATTSNRGYMSANDKVKLNDCMRCKVLTQVQYDALSSTDKNRADTLYFIKK